MVDLTCIYILKYYVSKYGWSKMAQETKGKHGNFICIHQTFFSEVAYSHQAEEYSVTGLIKF